jgi:hypothetical protein
MTSACSPFRRSADPPQPVEHVSTSLLFHTVPNKAHLPVFKAKSASPPFSLLQSVSFFPTLSVGVIVGAFEGNRLEALKMPKLTTKSVQALKEPGRYGDGDSGLASITRNGATPKLECPIQRANRTWLRRI